MNAMVVKPDGAMPRPKMLCLIAMIRSWSGECVDMPGPTACRYCPEHNKEEHQGPVQTIDSYRRWYPDGECDVSPWNEAVHD